MSNKLMAETVSSIRELAEQVSYDETGGGIEIYYMNRYSYTPLPMEINETLLRLLVLADKMEAALKGVSK